MGELVYIDNNNNDILLSSAIFQKSGSPRNDEQRVIGVLTGEGIGPEVIDAALQVLDTILSTTNLSFTILYGTEIGLPAKEKHGKALTRDTINFCHSVFKQNGAILCGPGGGRFVYEIRSEFDLFCKLTPIRSIAPLLDAGVIKKDVRKNADIVMVRENISGAYFGKWGVTEDNNNILSAYHHIEYTLQEVERILKVAINLAKMRKQHVTLVVKPGGVPSISELWVETLKDLVDGEGIEYDILEIDNALYQLIASARKFDVVVSPNMFGDALADCGALLLGSRGMSYSANYNANGAAIYQTGHGAAHDLAGKGNANPIGQIMSLVMLLHESFGLTDVSHLIKASIEEVLAHGWRTPDIASTDSKVIGTAEMADRICKALGENIFASATRS